MNKSELIDRIANAADISKAAAGRAVDAALDGITDSLQQSDPVVLVGFGTFTVRDRAARVGRNPQTGAPIQIPAAKVPAFKPGKALKAALTEPTSRPLETLKSRARTAPIFLFTRWTPYTEQLRTPPRFAAGRDSEPCVFGVTNFLEPNLCFRK